MRRSQHCQQALGAGGPSGSPADDDEEDIISISSTEDLITILSDEEPTVENEVILEINNCVIRISSNEEPTDENEAILEINNGVIRILSDEEPTIENEAICVYEYTDDESVVAAAVPSASPSSSPDTFQENFYRAPFMATSRPLMSMADSINLQHVPLQFRYDFRI